MAAVAKNPNRNIYLRQGARIIKQNRGEPEPEPPIEPRDPNAKSWSAHLIGGKKMQLLGFVEAAIEAAAIERVVVLFSLDDARRKRLAVNLRRQPAREVAGGRNGAGVAPACFATGLSAPARALGGSRSAPVAGGKRPDRGRQRAALIVSSTTSRTMGWPPSADAFIDAHDCLDPFGSLPYALLVRVKSSCSYMSDIDKTRLEKVCAELGDAVMAPAMWSEIIHQISVAVGATGAVLLQRDVRTSDIPRSHGLDEIVRAYFANRWHVADIRAERGVRVALKGETVLIDQHVVTPEEMNRLAFYTELLAPYGFSWFAAIRFWAGPAPWGLTIQRTTKEGPFEVNDKRTLSQLSQRLTEVATLSAAVGRIALSSAINALNAVRQPAIAIDRLGFVLDANAEAEGLFDTSGS